VKKKALIITWTNFSDEELIYAYYRLLEDNFDVTIMSDVVSNPKNKKPLKGVNGVCFHSDNIIEDLSYYSYRSSSVDFMNEFDLLILPGGVKGMEKLRQEKLVIDFISEWNRQGKIIASICWAAQLLISAKVVKGRRISGYYSIKDDIENAGATYVDEPAVVSDNIISTAHYKDLAPWMKKVLEIYYERNK